MPELEILDPSGHLTLQWNVEDPASVQQARDEFERLKGCGFAFFMSDEPSSPKITKLKGKALERSGALTIRLSREFDPRATRTVAVPPHRGG